MEVIFINDVILIGVATEVAKEIICDDQQYQKVSIEVAYSSSDKRTVLINCLVAPNIFDRFKKPVKVGDSIGVQGYLSFDSNKQIVIMAEDCTSFTKQSNP